MTSPNQPKMSVSEALCVAEELRLTAETHAKALFGRDLALVVLAQRVRELSVEFRRREK